MDSNDTPVCALLCCIEGVVCCANSDHDAPDDCPRCQDYVAQTEPLRIPDAERQRCEVWTRVMGYHRPVSAWNAGKQQEHRDRVQFREGQGHD